METKTEIWRPVAGYGGRYEVSSMGRVRSLYNKRGKPLAEPLIMKTYVEKSSGYVRITMWMNGNRKHFDVHRMVLETFCGAAPEGCECDHINADRTDNRLENLRWLPHRVNMSLIAHNPHNCHFKPLTYRVYPYEFAHDGMPLPDTIYHECIGQREVSLYTGIPRMYLKTCLNMSLRMGKNYSCFPKHGFTVVREK